MIIDPQIDAHIRAIQQSVPSTHRPPRTKPSGIHLGVVAYIPRNGGFGFLKPDSTLDGLQPGDDLYVGKGAWKKAADLRLGDRVSFNVKPAKKPGTIEAVDVHLVADLAEAA